MFEYFRIWKGESAFWEKVDREELLSLEAHRQCPEGTVEAIEKSLESGKCSIFLQSPGAFYKIRKYKDKQKART